MTLTCRIFRSIDEVNPADWRTLGDPAGDLAMDPRQIRTLEKSLADQFKTWIVLVQEGDTLLGAACLALFRVDALETTGPRLRAITRQIRRVWPGFLRIGVVFCGLPIPSGSTHVRLAPGIDPGPVLGQIDQAMRQLARDNGAHLLTWKELNAEESSRLAGTLQTLGYLPGDIPAEHTLEGGFRSFDDYLHQLKARYRQQITRSQKKLTAAGYRVAFATGKDICSIYTDRVHQLYLNVRDRSQYRLETFSADYFRNLAAAFGEQAILTYVLDRDEIVAFLFTLTAGTTHYNLYAGIDYARNDQADLYFNVHYHGMDRSFQHGAKLIHLGQTADDYKSRLGSVAWPLHFYARAVNPVMNAGLRLVAKWAFPAIAPPPSYHVFREDMPVASPAAAAAITPDHATAHHSPSR